MFTENCKDFISTVPLFKNLDEESLHTINLAGKIINHKEKSYILIEGEESPGLFIVMEGYVKLLIETHENNEIVLSISSKYEVLGLFELFYNKNSSFTAISLKDSKLLFIPKTVLAKKLQSNITLLHNINQELIKYLDRTHETIKILNQKESIKKTVYTVYLLAEKFGIPQGNTMVIKNLPAQYELAQMSCTSREGISRNLNCLKKENLISYKSANLIIHDYKKFRDIIFPRFNM